MSQTRMPVLYIPHGGGPWPFVELPMVDHQEKEELTGALKALPKQLGAEPKALLVVSAHWEEPVATVMTAAQPPLLYDYYGFPPAAYDLQWPAPGHPQLATRVQELLVGAGLKVATNAQRGFDHGTFIPFKVMYPEAQVPTIQLSLLQSLDPAEHLALGRALMPLRDEGVLIVGSGMSYHNMRGFMTAQGRSASETFDTWLQQTATAPHAERDQQLLRWAAAPGARAAHPREEHLLPLMVAAGAAGQEQGKLSYSGLFARTRISGFRFG